MYIKRYTLASLMLLGFIGWYVYTHITKDTMGLEIYGIVIPPLHIALLVVVPAIILFIFSVFHMAFHSMVNNLKMRKYDKDYNEITESLVDAFLAKKERKHLYRTERYKLIGDILDNSSLKPNANISKNTTNDKINAVLRVLSDIEEGVSVDLRQYGLKPSNPLVIQNNRNKFRNGDLSAEEILKDQSNYDEDLCKEAYVRYAKTYSVNGIMQHKSLMTKEALFAILERVNHGEHSIEMSNEQIMELFALLDLNAKEYIEASMILANGMEPDQRIKLFEALSQKNEIAMEAYLYTLFDLEMLSVAHEILETSQEDEYLKFKAYAALKESHQNSFDISLFL